MIHTDRIDLYSVWAFGAALVYQNRSGQNYSRHGGDSTDSQRCGIFYIHLDLIFSVTYWTLGAALSYNEQLNIFSYI